MLNLLRDPLLELGLPDQRVGKESVDQPIPCRWPENDQQQQHDNGSHSASSNDRNAFDNPQGVSRMYGRALDQASKYGTNNQNSHHRGLGLPRFHGEVTVWVQAT